MKTVGRTTLQSPRSPSARHGRTSSPSQEVRKQHLRQLFAADDQRGKR